MRENVFSQVMTEYMTLRENFNANYYNLCVISTQNTNPALQNSDILCQTHHHWILIVIKRNMDIRT